MEGGVRDRSAHDVARRANAIGAEQLAVIFVRLINEH